MSQKTVFQYHQEQINKAFNPYNNTLLETKKKVNRSARMLLAYGFTFAEIQVMIHKAREVNNLSPLEA